MEVKQMLETKWRTLCMSGEKVKISSFLMAITDVEKFGSVIVPKGFHEKFGASLPARIGLKCKNYMWVVKFDTKCRTIYGLSSFMKYYGVKIYNMLQLDYYGDGLFEVKVFKETAVECCYPSMHPKEFLKSEAAKEYKKDKYMPDSDSVVWGNILSLLTFNGNGKFQEYVELVVSDSNVHPKLVYMDLDPSWEIFYKNWAHRSKVSLRLPNKTWEVLIQWSAQTCRFGNGWLQFARDVGLEVGDTLILFRHNTKANNLLNVCIFKKEEYDDEVEEDWEKRKFSFFNVVYRGATEDGRIFIPRMDRRSCVFKVRNANKITVDGETWFLLFHVVDDFMYNIARLLKFFAVKEREIMIFILDDSSTMTCRIYQKDGMKIDYKLRRLGIDSTVSNHSIWTDEASDVSSINYLLY